MTSGLTLAGGSAVARRTILAYRPTTELVSQRTTNSTNQAYIPWSQREKQTTKSRMVEQQSLSGAGSAHSTISLPAGGRKSQPSTIPNAQSRVGRSKPSTISELTSRNSSSSQPQDSKLLTPPRRRLVVKAVGVGTSTSLSTSTSTIKNVSPQRTTISPVKQRPPSIVLDASSETKRSEEDDLTSLSHCIVGVPRKTNQALRLVRILLNQPTLRSVTKLYVNQAIQRHMHTLKELQSTRQAKQILETQLEIAKTDSDIAKAACVSAEQQLKAVKWKLAKERQATKDKLAAAAATMAMSTSIAPTSSNAANLPDIVAMVEKTVVSLRAKEKVLRELNGNAENDETTAMVEQLELESKLLRQHLDPDGCSDEDSDSTPVMGHQSFSSMDSKEGEINKSSWSKEKKELKREFEETIAAAERKIDQLKSVLTVCNERRLRAEQFLTESQKEILIQFTVENQEQLAHNNSLVVKSSHGNEIKVESVEIVDQIDDDLESSQMNLEVTENENQTHEGLLKEVNALKEKLQNFETTTNLLTKETAELKEKLQAAKHAQKLQENKVVELEKSLYQAEMKVFDILCVGKEQALDEKNLRIETIGEDLAHATEDLTRSKKRVLELESELATTKQQLSNCLISMETATRHQKSTEAELKETTMVLEAVRIELETLQELKQPRKKVINSRSAVRQAEAKVGAIRARLLHTPSPNKIVACERISQDGFGSDGLNATEMGISQPNHEGEAEENSFQLGSTAVLDCDVPTQDQMDSDTEKITKIHEAYTSSQSTVQSLRALDSTVSLLLTPNRLSEVSIAMPGDVALEGLVDKDEEIIDLKRQLAEKSLKLLEAERYIATFKDEAKKDKSVEDAILLEEMENLKQKVVSSTEELNETQGKLIFLRNVVLSVVPWEEEDEPEETNCSEVEAKC